MDGPRDGYPGPPSDGEIDVEKGLQRADRPGAVREGGVARPGESPATLGRRLPKMSSVVFSEKSTTVGMLLRAMASMSFAASGSAGSATLGSSNCLYTATDGTAAP